MLFMYMYISSIWRNKSWNKKNTPKNQLKKVLWKIYMVKRCNRRLSSYIWIMLYLDHVIFGSCYIDSMTKCGIQWCTLISILLLCNGIYM